MFLHQLLPDLPVEYDCHITGLALDSRKVQPNNLFLAMAGTQTHGEQFIEAAIRNGAVAILKEAPVAQIEWLAEKIPCITLPQLSQQLGAIAARFYNHPTDALQVIGVTGTNGKTSVTHFIAQVLSAQAPCGLIGTLGYGTYQHLQAGQHTTPDALALQSLFAQLRDQKNVAKVVMEVSSHALVQGRVNAINFEIAVLTNLSRDHLDYHQTMEAYASAKKQLFKFPKLRTAIINDDDAFGQSILAELPPTVTPLTYSLTHATADVFVQQLQPDVAGYWLEVHTPWGHGKLKSPLYGRFNVSNLLAALTTLLQIGLPLPQVLTQLSTVSAVSGRMERFGHAHQPTVIIDYAHTPDALEKVLQTLREHCRGQLWCVFGCGGNRDQGKRPLMGAVASRYADKIIITDDNPRFEDSQVIIDAILQGCPQPTAVIPDRKQAISHALAQAQLEDIVLIAGKGHETYQQIGEQRLPFSDREVVTELLKSAT